MGLNQPGNDKAGAGSLIFMVGMGQMYNSNIRKKNIYK